MSTKAKSIVARVFAGLFFIGWGAAVGFGFILLNVGPCNNRPIPLERSAPIGAIVFVYWILGLLRWTGKDSRWLHYGLWGAAAFLALQELPVWADRDWETFLFFTGLLLVVCAPSIVLRLCLLPAFQTSPRRKQAMVGGTIVVCAVIIVWLFGPIGLSFF